jgi:hypothetical protein
LKPALLALTFLISGCATCGVGGAPRAYPAPAPEELLSALRARQQAVRSVDLDTRTTSWLGGQRTRGTVVMLVERDGRLRFEAEVSLQGAVATLATGAQEFALLDLQQHVFKKGEACPANVASLVPVPLVPLEAAAVLLGDAPVAPGAQVTGVEWDPRLGAEVLGLDNGAGAFTRRVFVQLRRRGSGADVRWDVVGVLGQRAPEAPSWRVAFDDLKIEEGVAFPEVIRFAEPGKSFDDGLEIKVKSRRVNPQLKPQAFTLTAPEGYPVEVVPCPPP